MKITLFGTRGSVPVCDPDMIRYGGNTTCLRVESSCIPATHALVVDGGSGFMPLSKSLLRQGIQTIDLLMTHYHHDHSQGLPLSPATFHPNVRFKVYGPVENQFGPKAALEAIMTPPLHPISFREIASRFDFFGINLPPTVVLVFHPVGGVRKIGVKELKGIEESQSQQVNFGQKGRYLLAQCLVVPMRYTEHPQRTMTYRFEDRKVGKTFVFLTDHENTDGLHVQLREHLKGADLLIMDAQYSREKYQKCAGFGHGTPDYCVRVAHETGAKRLGLTHHDPLSTDQDIDNILEAARAYAREIGYGGDVFACADYQEIAL